MISDLDLTINSELVTSRIVNFIRDQTACVGYSKGVIGLSGGIDSSLSCILAVKALGKDNVLGIRMPYETTSQTSLLHAQLLIDQLGINSLTIPITPLVDTFLELFPDADNIRRGNIMARTRMIILFDQSKAFDGLVIGTGNRTEYLLGYTTIYGDNACSFNPIGDLYKTQVRQLSADLGIPQQIISKPPSADLWAGQTDEGELGFTYEDVDRLLFHKYDLQADRSEMISAGFSEEFIDLVEGRIRNSEFKRRLPPYPSLR